MNVTIENLSPCKRLLRIEVPAQEVDTAFNNTTQAYQKQARLPGFRPGKAPRAMVLKKFESDILKEVKRKLVPESYQKAIKENELKPVNYPEIEETQFAKGMDLKFSATVEIAPEFELPEYKGLAAKVGNNEVTDDDVERAINILRERQAKYETVDREVQDTDIAVVNYTGTVDGKPVIETAPSATGLNKQENFWINVAEDSFLPGFGTQLLGAKKGDKKTVTITFPGDFVTSELAGKEGAFEVEIGEVKKRSLPELDQAFAESYGAESVEKLREGVRADLETELKNKKSRDVRNQVIKSLLGQVQFDLPESVVAEETRNVVYQIVQENQSRGLPQEVIERQKDQIYSAASSGAQERVKANFIFRKIAEKEEIKVGKEEMSARLHMIAQSQQMPIDKVVKKLEENNGFAQIYEQLMTEKVVKLLEEHAALEAVDPKELEAPRA